MGYDNDYKISEFNAAGLKMIRLNKIQDTLNQINGNLLQVNVVFGVYNFELKFRMIEQLYQEVESKLTPEEKTSAIELHDAIKSFLAKYPIFNKQNTGYFTSPQIKVNFKCWNIIEKYLFQYESIVRGLIDMHGMDTFYNDDDMEGL